MSTFTYIILPREIDDALYKIDDETGYILYDNPASHSLIPWFLKWKTDDFSENDFKPIALDQNITELYFDLTTGFTYELSGDFEKELDKRYIEHCKKLLGKEKTMDIVSKKILTDNISRHQLYHLIDNNIHSGEKAEIYSLQLGIDAHLNTELPKKIFEIKTVDIFDNNKFYQTTKYNSLYIIKKP
ncbi:MAG: hypothetical protein PUD43_06635 [Clostridia bacterium]|nr:hypothetical protein [Clostridia bacterium]